jgi:nitrite reductase/ring-hydroxylating ferredoxin subunit
MTDDDFPDSAVDARDAADKSECVRRSVLRGAVVLGAVGIGGALSRIGAGSSSAAASLASAPGTTPITQTAAAPASGGKVGAGAGAGAKKGRSLGLASKVPIGGGVIYGAAKVVVTQPTAGEYKAFSATCTHQQCLLADVAGGTINCVCHGGAFSITDGSAVKFPAIDPLPAKTVTVAGGKLFVT